MTVSPKTAFVFPGQGSQKVGMGFDLYSTYPSARRVFDETDAALGFPLSQLCFEGPEEELTKTKNVQPAILAASIACLEAAREAATEALPSPAFLAGHSLGEYAALVAAEALTLSNAARLVRDRGRLMYECGLKKPGSMLAILSLDEATVKQVCLDSGTEISNVNCPGQIVVSGATDCLAQAGKLAKERGAPRIVPLKVSGAFHSALMDPVIDEFKEIVFGTPLSAPAVPVVANVTGQPLTDVDSVRQELVRQLRNCIQWQSSVEYMAGEGVDSFYEIGPGQVLSGLIRRINPDLLTTNLSDAASLEELATARRSVPDQ